MGAAKRHVSLFIMYGAVLQTYKDELSAFDTSNTVIRFMPNKPLSARLVTKLVKARMAEIERVDQTDARDPRVDEYIDALPDWQQVICREVRELVHAADGEVSETIKFTNRPYFVLHGNICALLAAKDHVNVFLYDGAIVPDPENIITSGHDNKTARTVAIRQGEAINARALTAMFKQIIANNRAGGWRRLKRD
jgi:hypothetical protein